MVYNTIWITLKYQRNEGSKESVAILKVKRGWYITLHSNIRAFPTPILYIILLSMSLSIYKYRKYISLIPQEYIEYTATTYIATPCVNIWNKKSMFRQILRVPQNLHSYYLQYSHLRITWYINNHPWMLHALRHAYVHPLYIFNDPLMPVLKLLASKLHVCKKNHKSMACA